MASCGAKGLLGQSTRRGRIAHWTWLASFSIPWDGFATKWSEWISMLIMFTIRGHRATIFIHDEVKYLGCRWLTWHTEAQDFAGLIQMDMFAFTGRGTRWFPWMKTTLQQNIVRERVFNSSRHNLFSRATSVTLNVAAGNTGMEPKLCVNLLFSHA